MSARIIPAILSGGAGTRLWPLSTEARPKQFHTLGWPETLFARTLARVSDRDLFLPPLVLCGAAHTPLAREAMGETPATFVIEPSPRNTAAVAVIAAAVAAEMDPDALVLLQPSDHLVGDAGAFREAIRIGADVAHDSIVTFGVAPTRPATNYGYIKRARADDARVFAIEAFKEKPDEATARGYLASGDYFWNAGIFLFHPATLLEEFAASADIRDGALEALRRARRSGDRLILDAETFAKVRAAPLDIAVMEETDRGVVVPCNIGWADIGTWDEVWRLAPRDGEGFAMLGEATAADASKIEAAGVKAAVIEGEDLIVLAAPNGVIILPRAQARDAIALRKIAEAL